MLPPSAEYTTELHKLVAFGVSPDSSPRLSTIVLAATTGHTGMTMSVLDDVSVGFLDQLCLILQCSSGGDLSTYRHGKNILRSRAMSFGSGAW